MSGRPRRVNPALARKQAEQKILQRIAATADRDALMAAQTGPHGAALRDLQRFLRGMQPGDGRALVEFVGASALSSADDRTRLLALRLIGDAVRRVKSRAGLPDGDPMPGQPESAWQACRRLLRETPP